MKTIKLLHLAVLLLIPNLIYCQLTYTIQVTNNTSCECEYDGPSILINQLGFKPTVGDGSVFGLYDVTSSMPRRGEWIELYNPNPCEAIDLSKYVIQNIANSVDAPNSVLIPSGTIIPPLGFGVIRGVMAPAPPSGVTDILIDINTADYCIPNSPYDNFYLSNGACWIGIYSSNGVLLDGVKYRTDDDWYQGFSMVYYPCVLPNSILPANFTSNSMYQIGQMYPVTQYVDIFTSTIPVGSTIARIPDGGAWSTSFQNEAVSYGACNVPGGCAQSITNCNGSATVTMTSGAPPISYSWNTTPSQNTPTATGLCAGDYCVTVTDALGVSEVICVTIIDELFDINSTVQHTSCNQNNGSITLAPEGNGPFTYMWTPNLSSNNTASSLSSGTYLVTVNNGSCNKDTSIVILPSIGVAASITEIPISCVSNTGSATVELSGGIAPYSILWSNGSAIDSISTIPGTTYICTVTDSSGCVSSDTITPITPIVPITIASYNNPLCEGNVLNLTASNSNVSGVSFTWTGPNNYSSTQQNSTTNNIDSTFSGDYIVTVSINDCFSTDTIHVDVNPLPVISISTNSSICEGDSLLFTSTCSISNSTYNWSGPNGFSSTNSTPYISNATLLANGQYTLLVTSTGCSSTQSTAATINAIPTVNLNSNSPVCLGQDLTLFAINQNNLPNIVYQWNGPNYFSSTIQNPIYSNATLTQSGKYYLNTSIDQCTFTDSLDVLIVSAPTANFTADTLRGCIPLTVQFTDLSDPICDSVFWNFGDGSNSNQGNTTSHTYIGDGDFSVQLITGTNGCYDTISMTNLIHVSPYAEASFLVDQPTAEVYDPSFVFTNTSTNANSYSWGFGDSSVDYSLHTSHEYTPIPGFYNVTLIATNPENCSDTSTLTIQILEPLIFYIPNTFTPDGDLHNQTFQPIFTSGFDSDSYKIYIFNRWGDIIFESTNTNEGWNGMHKNEIVQNGVYTWKINFKDGNNDKSYQYNGHVNLIR